MEFKPRTITTEQKQVLQQIGKDMEAERMTEESRRIREAERKARYGHKDWVYWRAPDGVLHVEVLTAASCEKALTDIGPDGKFYVIERNTANGFVYGQQIGRNMLAQLHRGII